MDLKIGSLGSNCRHSPVSIDRAMASQGLSDWLALRPAPGISDRDVEPKESRAGCTQVRTTLIDVSASRRVYGLRCGREGFIPRIQIIRTSALAERRIALPKGAVESLPSAYVIRFHVEHAPIEKSPAADWPFFD